MDTDFEVGVRPDDGVCPDCGRVIRDGVWFRHRQVAHGTGLTLAPTDAPHGTGGQDDLQPGVVARPPDGRCPDCGRRIAAELWDNHRQHVHGSGRPTTSGAAAPKSARGPVVAGGGRTAHRTSDAEQASKRAGLAWTISFALAALVGFLVYVGDITSWTAKSESCQVVGHVRRGTTPQTPQSCGFYAVAASFQNVALVLGAVALVLALVAPLIPALGGSGRQP